MQRLSKLHEEEKNRIQNRERKFFAAILDASRELQLQVQAAQKHRHELNENVKACYLIFFFYFYL